MIYFHRLLFPVMWLIWVVYWWLASKDVKPAARRESVRSRLLYSVPIGLGAVLLAVPAVEVPLLGARFLPRAPWPFEVRAVLTLAGLLFTVWARVHLGRNWSAIVTVKENHELITTGPYRIVRHPIYTGLLLGVIGTALARGQWSGVVAAALFAWSFWRKLKLEEQWMRERFGAAYESYSRHVAALLPFVL
jgi:protein-S-isoprenylcysteine O-methyltransferase Ste14